MANSYDLGLTEVKVDEHTTIPLAGRISAVDKFGFQCIVAESDRLQPNEDESLNQIMRKQQTRIR